MPVPAQPHRLPRGVRYAAAVAIPVAVTLAVSRLGLPPFVFEHLVVLLVVAIAIPWGLGPAIVAAVASVVADDVLLRDPIGRPTISGARDVLDLLLFAAIAVVVSELVRRAHAARVVAEQAAERERRAREDRDRVIATVTHDLATPLSVLAAAVQLLTRQPPGAGPELGPLLGPIERATARAASLVRALGDQTLEAPGVELRLAPEDLGRVVEPVVAMMDRFSELHPLHLAPAGQPLPVMADADRMQRVIENLVSNAIKYSPAGGAIEIALAADGGDAVLRVRDHGIGIAPDARPRIFEPGFRAREAAGCAPGRGLGLSISRHIVARHGGSIEAAPAEGRGTVVTVRMPLAPPPADRAAQQLADRPAAALDPATIGQ